MNLNEITIGQVWNYLFQILGTIRLGVLMWCFILLMSCFFIKFSRVKSFWWWFGWVNLPLSILYLFASAFVK